MSLRVIRANLVTSMNGFNTLLQGEKAPTSRTWYTVVIGWIQTGIDVCDSATVSLGTQIDFLKTHKDNINRTFDRIINNIKAEEAYFWSDPDTIG